MRTNNTTKSNRLIPAGQTLVKMIQADIEESEEVIRRREARIIVLRGYADLSANPGRCLFYMNEIAEFESKIQQERRKLAGYREELKEAGCDE